jgi:hypothetical protein
MHAILPDIVHDMSLPFVSRSVVAEQGQWTERVAYPETTGAEEEDMAMTHRGKLPSNLKTETSMI